MLKPYLAVIVTKEPTAETTATNMGLFWMIVSMALHLCCLPQIGRSWWKYGYIPKGDQNTQRRYTQQGNHVRNYIFVVFSSCGSRNMIKLQTHNSILVAGMRCQKLLSSKMKGKTELVLFNKLTQFRLFHRACNTD